MKVSIIIPSFKNEAYLKFCLSSISNSGYEIIVVNNGGGESTSALARSHNAKVVELDRNRGFAAACNAGAKAAKGELLLFLNDDAIMLPQSVERLVDCFEKSKAQPVGAVGPRSNAVAGEQHIPRRRLNPSNYPDEAEYFFDKFRGDWQIKGFLSGFCILTSQKIFKEVQGFDEKFFAGFEDNDFCLKLQKKGYKLVVAGDVLVFHFSGKTLERFPELKFGVRDWKLFVENHPPDDPRLAVAFRVKIGNEFFANVFRKSLEVCSRFADGIFILDDGSSVDVKPILEGIPHVVRYKKYFRELMESRDRQELVDWAMEEGFNWFLSVDADEIPEEAFLSVLPQLLNPIDPSILGYTVSHYCFWNTPNQVRSDGIFGGMYGVRLVRLLPNSVVAGGTASGFHCGNVPAIPMYNCRFTSLRMKHLGYLRPQDRIEKYNFYTQHDPSPDPWLVGRSDYSHLVNDFGAQFCPWIEPNDISLATIVKNEEGSLWDFLRWNKYFFKEVVLVDTGSSDKTVEVAKSLGCKVSEFDGEFNFSAARNKAIRSCKSNWILQLDPDEQLPDYPKVRRMLESPADGYMFVVRNLQKNGTFSVSESIRLFRNDPRWWYDGLVHESFDKAVKEHNLVVYSSPVRIDHYGYLKPTSVVKQKLKEYFKLNVRQMKENPDDERPYFNLALHYLDCNKPHIAKLLLDRSVMLNPNFFQPRMELIPFYLKEALMHAEAILSILPEGTHPSRGYVMNVIAWLEKLIQKRVSIFPELLEEVGDPFNQISQADDKEGGEGEQRECTVAV